MKQQCKKIFIIIFCFLLILLCYSCNQGNTTENGIKYQIHEGSQNVTVVGKSKNVKELIIQDNIEGYSVIGIEGDAFKGSDITKIVIPNSFISVEGFTDCILLKEVILSENIKIISTDCFKGCISLEEISIKCKMENNVNIGGNAFENCTALKTLNIENVKAIWPYAFKGCISLKKVYLDKNLLSVGVEAFADCGSLEIYCEVAEKPEKWQDGWNGKAVVHWGTTKDDMNNG